MAGAEKNCQKRTVVIIGKTGAGKSTVANKLLNHKSFKARMDYESVTEDVKYAEIEVSVDRSVNQEEEKFTFRIVDTTGFSSTTKRWKDHDNVLAKIKNFFQEKAPEGVNLVVFVFSGSRFTDEEKKVFDYLTKNFVKEISGASALVITHCENLVEEARHDLIREFKNNRLTKPYANFMGKGIYTVGFPDLEKTLPQLREVHKQMMRKDQQKLINLVISSSTTHLGEEMFESSLWDKLSKCTIL